MQLHAGDEYALLLNKMLAERTCMNIRSTVATADLKGLEVWLSFHSSCKGLIPCALSSQAQRARTALLQEVVGLMAEAGIDAFIGNTSEELAMANLASLPTIAVPLGTQPLKDAPDSPRKRPISLGIFGSPQTDTNV